MATLLEHVDPTAAGRASRRLLAVGNWGTFLACVAGYLVFSYWVAHHTLYTQGLVTVAAIFAILAVSLDLVAGITGLYSLGHAGLFALGAYGTVLINQHAGWSTFWLLPIAIAGVGAVGLGLGIVSLRVSGLYFAITTFVFTLVVAVLLSDLKFTGGYGGLIGPIFPEFSGGLHWLGVSFVWATMIGLLVAVMIVLAIRKSPFYPVLLAIRDAEPFAAAAGVRTSLVKVGVFGLSAGLAGLAGWLFAFQAIISPSQFSWTVSVNILVMVILGGMNTTLGPIAGAAFVSMFPAWVNINALWQEVLFGALFILVIVAYPAGAVGLVRALATTALRFALARSGRRSHLPSATPTGAQPLPQDVTDSESPAPLPDPLEEAVTHAIAASEAEAPQSESAAIACRDVVFSYGGGVRVLNNVEFVVKRGTIHGLIGPNGSGKSTLVDLIAGRLRPDRGTIELNGRRFDSAGPAARAKHGFMRTFQAAVLVRELASRENVLIGLYSRVPRIALRAPAWPVLPTARRDARRMRGEASSALSFVGAAQWGGVRVADAPHGIQQLTQLAAACVAGPSTVILDEPLAGLSPAEVEHAAGILSSLRSAGVSVVLIEHQPRFVFSICDEVTVLNAGEVVASGPAAEVRANQRVREVYLGQ